MIYLVAYFFRDVHVYIWRDGNRIFAGFTVPRYRIDDSAARRAEMYLFRRTHYYFGDIYVAEIGSGRNRPERYSENWNGRDFADNSENWLPPHNGIQRFMAILNAIIT